KDFPRYDGEMVFAEDLTVERASLGKDHLAVITRKVLPEATSESLWNDDALNITEVEFQVTLDSPFALHIVVLGPIVGLERIEKLQAGQELAVDEFPPKVKRPSKLPRLHIKSSLDFGCIELHAQARIPLVEFIKSLRVRCESLRALDEMRHKRWPPISRNVHYGGSSLTH